MTEAINEINELLAQARVDLAACWEPSKRAARQYEVDRCERFLAVLTRRSTNVDKNQHQKNSENGLVPFQ